MQINKRRRVSSHHLNVKLAKMLQTQLETSKKITAKCMSKMEDMTKEMQEIRDEHTSKLGQIKEVEMSKKLDEGALDGLNVSSEIVEQLQELKEQVDALTAAKEQIQDALLEEQRANSEEFKELHSDLDELQLNKADRAEVDVVQDALLIFQDANREEFKKLFAFCEKLQVNKADRSEMDLKADKSSLDNKVDYSLFNSQTTDIDKTFNVIVDQMDNNDEAWNQQLEVLSDDIDGKVDRLELEPLKKWLLNKFKAFDDQLNKQNQSPVVDDDAYLVPISMPSVLSHQALLPRRPRRARLTLKMDQIEQHAKRMYAGIDRPESW